MQTNSSGTVTAERQYDAFGNVIASSGAWKSQFGNAGRFGYQEDPDSGLKLLGHRYYDSSTGRFLTRDPIKDGRNWYSYCENGPVASYDADGLNKVIIVIGQPMGDENDAWFKYEDELVKLLIEEYLALGYAREDIIIMRWPTEGRLGEAMAQADVDGVIFLGHGSAAGGTLRRDQNGVPTDTFSPRLCKKYGVKLKFIRLITCKAGEREGRGPQWGQFATYVEAYIGKN